MVLFSTLSGVSGSAEIGIYNPALEGGRAAGVQPIAAALIDEGFGVSEFPRISMENLLQFRAVIIPNTRTLGDNEDPRWRDNLRAYVVEAGGSVIFNHDSVGAERSPFGLLPLFPEVVVPGSVERQEFMLLHVDLPADPLLRDFDFLPERGEGDIVEHMYFDRFVFDVDRGTVILSDPETRKAAAAAGRVGAGRVFFSGLIGADPVTHQALRLEGIELEVIVNAARWALEGEGLVVTDPASVEVKPWRPEIESDRPEIAIVGSSESHIRQDAREIIGGVVGSHDFIPLEFLRVRDLSAEDYGLVILFAPDTIQPEFEKITEYLDSGGKAVVFMPGSIPHASFANNLLGRFDSRRLGGGRDNWDNLSIVRWEDARGDILELRDVFPNYNAFTHISEPESEDAEPAGYWYDHRGERKSPAIIRTPFGYITNINFMGDVRLFIANAVAELMPGAGEEVFSNLAASYRKTEEAVIDREFPAGAGQVKARAGQMRQAAEDTARAGDYLSANKLILEAEKELVRAYAASMPSVPGEELIAFVMNRSHPDPDIICERLARAGFTGVCVLFRAGDYPSKVFEREQVEIDWFQKWIEAARRHGLKIGPSISTFSLYEGTELYGRAVEEDWRVYHGNPPRPHGEREGRRGRLTPCRARPEVIENAISKSSEIIENYPVDYIFYDVIRWEAGRRTCYCDYCREAFIKDTGIQIGDWPADVAGRYEDEYNDWRAGAITSVVRGASENIARVNPEIKLGVFTFRHRFSSWHVGQYWWEWGDHVDYIMPMWYQPVLGETEELFKEINSLLPEGSRAGLMPCYAPPGERGGSDIIHLRQIDLQREYAPAGIHYFHYFWLSDDFLDLLRKGPFREG